MTIPATRLRRTLAERITAAFVSVGALAVILGGSTGRGEADRHSDIEVGVFWEHPPTEEQRTAAVDAAGADLHRLWPYSEADRAWFDDWFIGRRNGEPKSGIVVEPVHMTVTAVEETISDVVLRLDPALEKQVLLATLCDGVPLAGDAVLEEWRRAAATYPDELARAVVERYAQIEHFWRLAAFRERNNPMRTAAETVTVHEGVLQALLAVNRVYWYGFKSLDSLAARFRYAPPDLLPRLRAAYCAGPDRESSIAALVEDTYDLVERHVPGVDVDRLRVLFRYRRPVWDDELPELV